MFDISKNGIITISRGDNFTINVFVNIGTQLDPIQYKLEENDKLYFALMEPHQPFEYALIRKVFTKENEDECGNINMNFIPEDTEYLMPGNYYYMIKLARNIAGESGEEENYLVDTIISKTKFVIID
jgi:hypothetical protein